MSVRIHAHRLGNIWCGYSLSVIAAGSAISAVIATMTALGPNGFADYDLAGKIGGAISLAMLIAVFAVPFTLLFAFLPSAVAILYAEPREVRSPTAYALMGVLISAIAFAGLVVFVTWPSGNIAKVWSPPTMVWQVIWSAALVVLPGLCGGLTYWAKSGRYAGD
jgi:hypothetical protein